MHDIRSEMVLGNAEGRHHSSKRITMRWGTAGQCEIDMKFAPTC